MTNTKAMNISKLATDADFNKDAASIAKRGEAVQMDIHRHLYAIGFRWNETGDIRPAVKRVNDLLSVLPKGLRLNAVRAWVEAMFGFKHVAGTKEVPEHFIGGAIKGAALPMDSILNKRFFDFTPEPVYKPMDFGATLEKLLKQAGARANSAKGDVVDQEMLVAVQRALADLSEKRRAEYEANIAH